MSGSFVRWGANRCSDVVSFIGDTCATSSSPLFFQLCAASIPLPHLETYANRISGSYLSMDKADAIGTYANANPTCTSLHHPVAP